jgi:hypothetical protein
VKIIFIFILFFSAFQVARSQHVDSIFFNLYTDSLKKGTYNYINVEGRFTDGTYTPLTGKELKFTSTAGKFSGNSLYIDSSFADEKITVKAVLIKNPRLWQEIDIYIKKYEVAERLPTMDEVLNGRKTDTTAKKKRRRR